MFEYPLDLHYSQTGLDQAYLHQSLNTLWIYTTLKQENGFDMNLMGLNTLWIYTTLKRVRWRKRNRYCLNTLWIYTTLKHFNFVFINVFV